MNYTPEQFAKLPKWAQMEINRLNADLKAEQETLAAINGDPAVMPVVSWHHLMQEHPLPDHCSVRMNLPKGHVEFQIIDDYVRVSCYHNLIVMPSASNTVHLRVDHR